MKINWPSIVTRILSIIISTVLGFFILSVAIAISNHMTKISDCNKVEGQTFINGGCYRMIRVEQK